VGVIRHGGVQGEAVAVDGERFRGVGSGERGTPQAERSLARAGTVGDAIADGGRAELVEGILGLEVEVRLLGVFDEPSSCVRRRSIRAMIRSSRILICSSLGTATR
jgi:hypothetical protein